MLPTDPAEPEGARRDSSMSLLEQLAAGARDPAYGMDRRATLRHRPLLVGAVVLVLGVLTGTAAAQVRGSGGRTNAARAALVADVRARTAASDALAGRVASLREQVATERGALLGTSAAGRQARQRLGEIELASGQRAVHGPGILVRLDDAHPSGSPTPAPHAALATVQDRDLQDLVNGLWAAGAEAVTVDGLRITAQTAIRTAGEAILVDFRPVSPPYLVRAIGSDGLQTAFVDGTTGRRFSTYTSLYGLAFSVSASRDLTLPAAAAPDLRLVRPVTTP